MQLADTEPGGSFLSPVQSGLLPMTLCREPASHLIPDQKSSFDIHLFF